MARVAVLALMLAMCLGGPAPLHGDIRTLAPFDTCPSCNVPFASQDYAFVFAAADSNVMFSGHVHASLGMPGANGAAHVVCGNAELVIDGGVATTFVIESAGPGASLSRAFYESHPSRSGGFLADNLLVRDGAVPTSAGLLFKNARRYFDLEPPLKDDGSAPGPAPAGGFEMNLHDVGDGVHAVLRRYDAFARRYDAEWRGTFRSAKQSGSPPPSAGAARCPLPIHKRLYDLSFTTDGVNMMARGSFGAVSGIEGLSRGATELLVCGSITLHPSIARGGPLTYELVRAGPQLSYSPQYFQTYNGFYFFNNALFAHAAGEPHSIDANGWIFAARASDGWWELNVYHQNGTGVVCHGGPPALCKYTLDGTGDVFWIYQSSSDRLHDKAVGGLNVARRESCAVRGAPALAMARDPVSEADAEAPAASNTVGHNGALVAAAATAAAVGLGMAVVFCDAFKSSSESL